MKPGLTLESLTARIKKEVAEKEKRSQAKKLEAKAERQRRVLPEPTIYQRPNYWRPTAIIREYDRQFCDCCKNTQTAFKRQMVELRHLVDKSAKRITADKGESFDPELPVHVVINRSVIPECFDCAIVGKALEGLFQPQPREHHYNAQKI